MPRWAQHEVRDARSGDPLGELKEPVCRPIEANIRCRSACENQPLFSGGCCCFKVEGALKLGLEQVGVHFGVRFGVGVRGILEPELHDAIGFFLAQSIDFERVIREKANRITAPTSERLPLVPSSRLLDRLGLLDDEGRKEVEWIRRIRNNLVHG